MRRFLTFVLIFSAAASINLAQSANKAYRLFNFDENGGGGCAEYFRFVDLIEELKKQPESKGVIVIYVGAKKERFGNAMAYAREAKDYFSNSLGVPPAQVSIVIAEGKDFFNEEFWVVPKDAAMPDIKPATLNWDALTDKYHFSNACLQCEPSYHSLTDFQPNFEDYANILKEHPNYSGLVTVNNPLDVLQVRKELTAKYKVPRNRYRVRLLKKASDDPSVDLFIVPEKSTQTASIKSL